MALVNTQKVCYNICYKQAIMQDDAKIKNYMDAQLQKRVSATGSAIQINTESNLIEILSIDLVEKLKTGLKLALEDGSLNQQEYQTAVLKTEQLDAVQNVSQNMIKELLSEVSNILVSENDTDAQIIKDLNDIEKIWELMVQKIEKYDSISDNFIQIIAKSYKNLMDQNGLPCDPIVNI
jgi:hypothetical protein